MTKETSGDSVASFASLFEQSAGKSSGRLKTYRVGERIEGLVVSVGSSAIFVELDGKRQAMMDAAELLAADGTIPYRVGDKIAANIVEIDSVSDNIRIARSMGKMNNVAAIEQAKAAGVPIDGKVTAINKGGFEISLSGDVKAFCPVSQMDNKFVQDPAVFLNRSLQFLVTEVREGGRSIVLSRRSLVEREARESQQKMIAELVVGTVTRGTVTAVREFGAFVDLGGVEGLIPLSELSHVRGTSAADVVKAGDVVEVKIREVKHQPNAPKPQDQLKVTLSLKALSADPWDAIDSVVSVGKVAIGTVVRLADFGAFVRLASGIEGLLHISELGGKIEDISKSLSVGQSLAVVVRKIERESRRLSLSPAPEGSAVGANVPKSNLSIGMVVNGVVERIENYGIFVQIEGSAGRGGRGLIINGDLGVPRGADVRKLFPEGMKVVAKVVETGEGKLRLSIRAAKEDEERSQFDGYRESVKAAKNFGTFGDLLKNKLAKK